MNPSLQCFDFQELPVRVVERDGQPWFVATDVCRVLEIANNRDAVAALDEDERADVGITDTSSNGSTQRRAMVAVSESGLYALIFKSRKPQAKVFRKWVTSEVLPALRSAGRYEMAGGEAVEVTSLLRFVETTCAGWSLERQMDFGQTARRYAKAMGVVFQVGADPEMGRVFVFPRPMLERVHRSYSHQALLPDSAAVEFERLLEAFLVHDPSGVRHAPDVVRGMAKSMKLFPGVFGSNASLESERSGFGLLCHRFNGYKFPSGAQLCVWGVGMRRRYQINRLVREQSAAVLQDEGRAA